MVLGKSSTHFPHAPRWLLPGLATEPLVLREPTWGFPKIRGTILGVPIIRTIVFRGLYWGPLILGNYHIKNFNYSPSWCIKPKVTFDQTGPVWI